MLLVITKKQWKSNMIFTRSWSILKITSSRNKRNKTSERTCFRLNRPTMEMKKVMINQAIEISRKVSFLCHWRSSSLDSWDRVLIQAMCRERQINSLLCWRRKSIDSIRTRQLPWIEIIPVLWSTALSNRKLKIWYRKSNHRFNRFEGKLNPSRKKEIISSTIHLQWNIWSRKNSKCSRLTD